MHTWLKTDQMLEKDRKSPEFTQHHTPPPHLPGTLRGRKQLFFCFFGSNLGPHLTTKPFSDGSPRGPQGLILSEHEDTACADLLEAFLALFSCISDPFWPKILASGPPPDLRGRKSCKKLKKYQRATK